MTVAWSANTDLFLRELRAGHSWQYLPLTFFRLHGLPAEMPDLSVRKDISEAEHWKDSQDITIGEHAIEVKSRNEAFTSPESFPYATVIVDTISGWDQKVKKPLSYVMVSRPTGAMLCLRGTSNEDWTTEQKYDSVRNIRDDFYVAPKGKLRTMNALIEMLKRSA